MKQDNSRALAFIVAQELNQEELQHIAGGRRPDDPNPRTWVNGQWETEEIPFP